MRIVQIVQDYKGNEYVVELPDAAERLLEGYDEGRLEQLQMTVRSQSRAIGRLLGRLHAKGALELYDVSLVLEGDLASWQKSSLEEV